MLQGVQTSKDWDYARNVELTNGRCVPALLGSAPYCCSSMSVVLLPSRDYYVSMKFLARSLLHVVRLIVVYEYMLIGGAGMLGGR